MIVEVHHQAQSNDPKFEIPDNAIVTGSSVFVLSERERERRGDVRYSIDYVVPIWGQM